MKYLHIILIALSSVLFTSCSSMYHYVQVFKAESVDKNAPIKEFNGGLLYEDDNCAIYYSFWSNGGDASFEFHNKTNKIIYIDLRKTFFIRNGLAKDYYKERAWTNTKSQTYSQQTTQTNAVSASVSKGYSVGIGASYIGNFGAMPITSYDPVATSVSASVNKQLSYGALYATAHTSSSGMSSSSSLEVTEQPIIAIPPRSSKIIAEYSISDKLFVDCDLVRYPSDKTSMSFSVETSPLVFENYITYNFGEDTEDVVVRNEFYISSVTNYTEPEIFEYVERENKPCQNVTDDDTKKYQTKYPVKVYDSVLKINANSSFYLTYKKLSKRKLYKKGNFYYYNNYYDGYTKSGDNNNVK